MFNKWTKKKEKIKVVKIPTKPQKVVYNQWSGQKEIVESINPKKKISKEQFENPFDKTKLGDMTLIPYNDEDYNHMQSYLLPNNMQDAVSHETFFLELENLVNC